MVKKNQSIGSESNCSDMDESALPGMDVNRRKLLMGTLAGGAAAMLPLTGAIAKTDELISASKVSGRLLSWNDYLDLLQPAANLVDLTLEPASEQVRAELYRQLAMNLSSGYFMYFQSDELYPDWMPFLNSVFTLQPNPDDTYWLARVSDEGSYRITGTRGSVHLLTISVSPSIMGESDQLADQLQKINTGKTNEPVHNADNSGYYDIDKLTIGPNGEFDILISPERPVGYKGDWLPLKSGITNFMVRQRSYDWGNEQDARFAIERIDQKAVSAPLKPRMTKEEIDQRLRLHFGGYVERLSRMWLIYQNNVTKKGLINRLEFADIGGSVPAQVYWQGMYELEENEALILETEIPKNHRYWNVQLNDVLWNASEFIYRQSSLNGYQARIDSDGKFRGIISLRDPGVWNWLDPAGYLQGMIIGRWYEADSHPMPIIKRVAFDDIRNYLPKDTLFVTEEERAKQLRGRRIGGQLRRRW